MHTGKEIVLRTPEMNGPTSVQHLEQILATFPTQLIVLFWDRASWHKGVVVSQFLQAHPRIEALYFPVACPELNPQEHVWKATRHAVSYNHLMPKLPQLADQFQDHLAQSTFESSFLYRYGYGSTHCQNFIYSSISIYPKIRKGSLFCYRYAEVTKVYLTYLGGYKPLR